jgi:hypothetical protein
MGFAWNFVGGHKTMPDSAGHGLFAIFIVDL